MTRGKAPERVALEGIEVGTGHRDNQHGGGEGGIGEREPPEGHHQEHHAQQHPRDVEGAAQMVAVHHRLEVVAHGGEGQGDRTPVPVLLLHPEREPRSPNCAPHPAQVDRGPRHRGDGGGRLGQGRGRPAPGPGIRRTPPDLDEHGHHQQDPHRPHQAGHHRRPPPPTTTAGSWPPAPSRPNTAAGSVGVSQDQRVGGGGQGQQPHRPPGQGTVTQVVADQDRPSAAMAASAHRHWR